MQSSPLETLFPHLAGGGYRLTSPQTDEYNCVAWAAGDVQKWWWPTLDPDISFWPAEVPRERTLERFIQAYATLGYHVCETQDWEEGWEKVALYVNEAGLPTHAARQLPTSVWTSKLGGLEDIEHPALSGIAGEEYGHVSTILRRPL